MDNDLLFGAVLAALAAAIASRRARDAVGQLGARGFRSVWGTVGAVTRRARGLFPGGAVVDPDGAEDLPPATTVLISGAGNRFHRPSCRLVGAGAVGIDRGGAEASGHVPCAVCRP